MKKFRVTIATRCDGYVAEDVDQVSFKPIMGGILVVVEGNTTLYFNWDRIDYYKVEEQEVSE